MNRRVLLSILAFSTLTATAANFVGPNMQFPERDKVYLPKVDIGFTQYAPTSLNGTRKVALTFDDGPHATLTPKLLDVLKKYNVKATFFTLAENYNKKTIPVVKRIVDEGHILASHDDVHDNQNTEGRALYKAGLKKSIKLIKSFQKDETKEIYYRFPYGDYGRHAKYHHLNVMKEVSRELFGENCINFAFWNLDTSDWVTSNTPEKIAQNLISQIDGGVAYRYKLNKETKTYILEPYEITNPDGGGVTLMHDIHERSVVATEIFLEWAKNNNVEIIPLNDVEEFKYQNLDCRLKK